MTVTKTARIAISVRCDAGPVLELSAFLELTPTLVFWPPLGFVIVGGSAGSVMEGSGGNAGNVIDGFDVGNVGCTTASASCLLIALTYNVVEWEFTLRLALLYCTFPMHQRRLRGEMCITCYGSSLVADVVHHMCVRVCVGSQRAATEA